MTTLPHEEIIAKLDESGKAFRVLLLKTDITVPSMSVFTSSNAAIRPRSR